MAEDYFIFLVAPGRPFVKGVVTEYDIVFLAVVLNADDLLHDIAFRAVHVCCALIKSGICSFISFSLFRYFRLQKQQQLFVEHLDIHGRVIEFRR